MPEPVFGRDATDEWDDGWSRVPHGLWTLDVPAGAKVLLGWLHSHTGNYLSTVTMSRCRREVGSSSIYSWFDLLESAGLVAITRTDNGKPAKITLRMAPWRALIGQRDQSEIGLVTGPKSDCIEEQGEDHPSSLRSEEGVQTQEPRQLTVGERAAACATAYWDWFKSEHGDAKPTIEFMALRAVALRLLKSNYSDDEIVDGFMRARAWTAKSVAAEIERARAEHSNRTSGAPIPRAVARAFGLANPWLERRVGVHFQASRPHLMRLVAFFVEQGYGVGETMLRLAAALRAVPDGTAAIDALRTAMYRANVDRFTGEPADYPDAMERAYRNKFWRTEG